jgi:hypothetical protein
VLCVDLFFPSLSGLFVSCDMRFLFSFSPCSLPDDRSSLPARPDNETLLGHHVALTLFFNVLNELFDVQSF